MYIQTIYLLSVEDYPFIFKYNSKRNRLTAHPETNVYRKASKKISWY